MFRRSASVLILGALGTDHEVGLMGIALALQTPGTVFLGEVVNIWAPMVVDLYERSEMARLQSLYQTITVVTLSFRSLSRSSSCRTSSCESSPATVGRGAAGVVILLAVGNLFYTGTGPTSYVLSMRPSCPS